LKIEINSTSETSKKEKLSMTDYTYMLNHNRRWRVVREIDGVKEFIDLNDPDIQKYALVNTLKRAAWIARDAESVIEEMEEPFTYYDIWCEVSIDEGQTWTPVDESNGRVSNLPVWAYEGF
jgi:hypothetical protein